MKTTRKQSKKLTWYERNKNKQIEQQRVWRKKNPEEARRRTREYHLKAKYGISQDDFNFIFKRQRKRCVICKSPEPNHFRGWNVDHCHATSKVRGVLCHHCNLLLGHAKDNADILRAATSYLKTNG